MNLVSVDGAARLLASGAIVGIPTDTVYGLGVDPGNRLAIDRLYVLKGRPVDKPIGLLAHVPAAFDGWATVPEWAVEMTERYWPGPLTLVCRSGPLLPEGVGDPVRHTVGVRVPNHDVALTLLERTGPLAVTSANLSGQPECHSHESAQALLGSAIDGYLEGQAVLGLASTVIDVTGSQPVVLRPGPIAP